MNDSCHDLHRLEVYSVRIFYQNCQHDRPGVSNLQRNENNVSPRTFRSLLSARRCHGEMARRLVDNGTEIPTNERAFSFYPRGGFFFFSFYEVGIVVKFIYTFNGCCFLSFFKPYRFYLDEENLYT